MAIARVSRRLSVPLALALALALLAGVAPAPVRAASYAVTVDMNDGNSPGGNSDVLDLGGGCATSGTAPCSLRDAVIFANTRPDPTDTTTITLPAGTYTLTRTGTETAGYFGDLDLHGNITIVGAGAATTIVQASPTGSATGIDRVFAVGSGGFVATATIGGVTIRYGNAPGTDSGGGITVMQSGSTLTLNDCVVADNLATSGAGGGIYVRSGATLVATRTTIANNRGGVGGGIYADVGAITVTNSTIAGNTAGNAGGGIFSNGTLTLTNSTVSGNTSRNLGPSRPYLGGGIYTNTLTANNTLIAGNTAAGLDPDVAGDFAAGSKNNLLGDGSGATGITNGNNGNIVGTGASPINAQVDPTLRDNGTTNGTPTLALLPGSPAVDHGDDATCASTAGVAPVAGKDQRGVGRPQGAHCDIGAFEYVLAATTTALTSSANPATVGQSVTFTATVAGPGGTPTGTVTFKDGATILGTSPLAGGVTTFATSALAVGSHSIVAVYSGDAFFGANTSPPLGQIIGSAPPISITVTATATTLTVGATQQFTATCAYASAPAADCTASVTWTSDTPAVATVNASGVVSAVSPGTAKITAAMGAVSGSATVTVKGTTATTLAAGPNPAAVGQAVTFTATVSGAGGTPTGTVTLKEGATVLGGGTLFSGVATFITSALGAGNHAITAIYGGDATFATSTSPVLTQVVNGGGPPPASGLQFYPLAKPVRLLDTRAGSTAFVTPNKALAAGQTLSLPGQFSYQGVAIPATAQAIVGNATVANGANGTPAGFATIYPSGVPLPLTSNLNFVPGTVRPNAFTVALGADGKFDLYSSSGGDFVVDISGYYAPVGAGGLYFHPLAAPVRELDTRSGATAFVHPNATLTAGQTLNLPGSFAFNGIVIPASAKALVGNATVANGGNGTPAGFATLFPDDVPLPLASNLNFVPGTVAPNAFTVGVGGGGGYKLYSSSGGDFVVDITGYLDTTAAGGLLFTPLSAPVRELDTRSGATAFVHPDATLAAGQTLTLPGAFTFAGITVPVAAQALVGNATVANDGNGTPAGYATLYPDGVPLPLASNLNFVPGQVAPNAITVGVGADGKYDLYSSSGGDFIIDITGYFAAPGAAGVPAKAPATKPTG